MERDSILVRDQTSRIRICLITLCALLLFVAQGQAQRWWKVDVTGPPVRQSHAMAYDSARGEIVMFGGWTGYSDIKGDTWTWDGNLWSQEFPATNPPDRTSHVMAFDSARGVVVLFGGQSDSGPILSDTWEWNGSNWTQRFSISNPPARYGHALAYDSRNDNVVLYGGFSGSASLGDTWEWDSINWVERFPAISPSARVNHAMAYDAARARVVLFGGYYYDGVSWILDVDTWEWDGNNWKKIKSLGPGWRDYPGMAYHEGRNRVILFGGQNTSGRLGDTWEWDGAVWTPICPPGPSARNRIAMVYDYGRSRILLFGGRDDTGYLADSWEYLIQFDLGLKIKKVAPSSLKRPKNLRLVTRVMNHGVADSLSTVVYYYLSLDKTYDGDDILMGAVPLSPVPSKKSRKITSAFQVPMLVEPGDYYVIMTVEAGKSTVSKDQKEDERGSLPTPVSSCRRLHRRRRLPLARCWRCVSPKAGSQVSQSCLRCFTPNAGSTLANMSSVEAPPARCVRNRSITSPPISCG